MLTLLECSQTQLRAIADFADDPQNFSPLIEARIAPVIEQGELGKPDRLIGWESVEEWEMPTVGDTTFYATPCPPQK